MDNKNVFSAKNIGIIIISIVSLAVLIFGFVKATSGNDKKGSNSSSSIIKKKKKKMKSKTEQVIYFGSATCGYCKLQTPIMKQLKSDYKLSYYYIDASKLNSKDKDKILKALDIEGSTPTIAIVKNNKVIDVNIGYMEGKEAVEFFKRNKMLDDDAIYKPEEHLKDINFGEFYQNTYNFYINIIKETDSKASFLTNEYIIKDKELFEYLKTILNS